MGNIDAKDIEKFEEKMKFQKEKESDWIKTCVTSTSTILGILIALTDGKGETIATKYFFVFTILSLGLCTLFGLLYIQMYGDTAQRLVVDYLERTNNLSQKPPYLTSISPRKIFSTYERLFYYFLISSFISVICYGISTRIDFVELFKKTNQVQALPTIDKFAKKDTNSHKEYSDKQIIIHK